MKFYRDLIEAAGLGAFRKEVTAALFVLSATSVALLFLITGVPALALCIGALVLAFGVEIIRVRALSRQRALDQLWPQVFDSFQNASQTGIPLGEQLEYLSTNGPVRLRGHFRYLAKELDLGRDLAEALEEFRVALGSRHADYLALLLELSSELGEQGMAQTWQKAASQLRSEQALMGQVLAKQGWVSGSAKVALVAPWLIALVLIQLPQNKAAFGSELGALVLVFGLLLSAVAYALVNRMGALTLPGRIFYAS